MNFKVVVCLVSGLLCGNMFAAADRWPHTKTPQQWLFDGAISNVEGKVKQALEYGADVNARYYNGKTALMLAAENGHFLVVQYLVEKAGANVFLRNPSDGNKNALDYARQLSKRQQRETSIRKEDVVIRKKNDVARYLAPLFLERSE